MTELENTMIRQGDDETFGNWRNVILGIGLILLAISITIPFSALAISLGGLASCFAVIAGRQHYLAGLARANAR